MDRPRCVIRGKPRVRHIRRHLSIPRDYRIVDAVAVVGGVDAAVWRDERSNDGRSSEASRLEDDSADLFGSHNRHCKNANK